MKAMRVIALVLVAVTWAATACHADIEVRRGSDENPMVEIARSASAGASAGLLIGLAFAALDKGHDHGDLIRTSFAVGTLAGVGVGIYWVATRPQPRALIQVDENGTHVGFAPPELRPGGGTRLRCVNVRF